MRKTILTLMTLLLVFASCVAQTEPTNTPRPTRLGSSVYFKFCQTDAPTNPYQGQMYLDCDDLKVYQYYGTTWTWLLNGGGGSGEINTVEGYSGNDAGLSAWQSANSGKNLLRFNGDTGYLSWYDAGSSDWSELAPISFVQNNYLALDNTTAFTPNQDYEPATKKYVDDNAISSVEGYAYTGTVSGNDFDLVIGNSAEAAVEIDVANANVRIGSGTGSYWDLQDDSVFQGNNFYFNDGAGNPMLQIVSSGALQAPNVEIADITNAKSLITKEYHDANTAVITNAVTKLDVSGATNITEQNVIDGVLVRNVSGSNTITIEAMALDYTSNKSHLLVVYNPTPSTTLTVQGDTGVTLTSFTIPAGDDRIYTLVSHTDDVWVLLKDPSKHVIETETGTTMDMSGIVQSDFGSANSATTYTMTDIAVGGYHEKLINTTTEPTVTGATKFPNTASWVTGTDMVLCVKDFNGTRKFWFVEF